MSGVLAGSLWTSVIKPDKFLSGASGGVYALITAHLGTVIMNYRYLLINYSNKYIKIFDKKLFFFFCREMPLWPIRVLTVSVVAITDIGVYLYDNYIADRPQPIGITI